MLIVRESEILDAARLAPNLRAADAREIATADPHRTATQVLADGIILSDRCITAVEDGEILLVAGVGYPGCVWMLASDGLQRIKTTFIRDCRAYLDKWNDIYPVLWNYVDSRNALHIRFIQWCGGVFINQRNDIGTGEVPFYEFVRIRPCAVGQQR